MQSLSCVTDPKQVVTLVESPYFARLLQCTSILSVEFLEIPTLHFSCCVWQAQDYFVPSNPAYVKYNGLRQVSFCTGELICLQSSGAGVSCFHVALLKNSFIAFLPQLWRPKREKIRCWWQHARALILFQFFFLKKSFFGNTEIAVATLFCLILWNLEHFLHAFKYFITKCYTCFLYFFLACVAACFFAPHSFHPFI